MNIFLRNVLCGGSGLNFTPLNDSRISSGIIIALNINVDNTAVSGLCSCIILRNCICRLFSINIAGRIEVFSSSLAMLNVVMAPLVISNCFPSFTTFSILDGSESKSTILSASLARSSSTIHCKFYISFSKCWCIGQEEDDEEMLSPNEPHAI